MDLDFLNNASRCVIFVDLLHFGVFFVCLFFSVMVEPYPHVDSYYVVSSKCRLAAVDAGRRRFGFAASHGILRQRRPHLIEKIDGPSEGRL